MGFVLLQILFGAIDAAASIHAVQTFGGAIILFCTLILGVHFLCIIIGAKLFKLDIEQTFIASNACALGAPIAAAMALSFKRDDLVLPALLCGTLGYARGNFVGFALYATIGSMS